ncbi:MAG TPA: polymer-forming cytoskeletal protein [Verrucomicrobiae bacterium]|nr:polymer-forming cytoskeletal protein [Verrucomicrobiae bacterium]
MPASKQDKVLVACPHCGHSQEEPRTAFSTVCKKCRKNFRVQEALNPTRKTLEAAPERKRITCFECGKELEVPVSAQSSMCKWCSRYIDLQDYRIANAVSKNFKTKGAFALEPTGYVFNTEAVVGEAVIKGRFLGKLVAERTLAIYSTAEIKGSFTAGCLVIPVANRFRWNEAIKAGSAEIAGELAADLQVEGTITLKSTARLFGNMRAKSLVVEDGAVVVGNMQIGSKAH